MPANFPPPIAAIENVGQLVLVVLVIGAVVLALVASVLAMYLKHRREALWHETARLALDKGQPVPVADALAPGLQSAPARDVRAGMILLSFGAGIWFFLAMAGDRPSPWRFLGAIPGFVGISLLLYAAVAARFGARNRKDPDRSRLP